jgi:3-deoxy-manno-octulosonate cytidylyltransferase (CMP-KDO synthetase)
MTHAVVIIPVRLASRRIPRKPLVRLGALPLVEHVRRRALLACEQVIVATDSLEVADVVEAFGGVVQLTGDCANGTERCAEAARLLQKIPDVVVNVQGDQPLVNPDHIRRVMELCCDGAPMATLVRPLGSSEDPHDPALVKVVLDQAGRALYFSRAAIPVQGPFLVHLGIYGFTHDALQEYAALPGGGLAASEDLEQLRWIEAGRSVKAAVVEGAESSIDTPDHLDQFRLRFRGENHA